MRMKKWKFVAIILAACMVLGVFAGCDLLEAWLDSDDPPVQEQPGDMEDPNDQQGSNDQQNPNDSQDPSEPQDPETPVKPLVAVMNASDRYLAEPVRDVMDDMISYRDEDHYYYMFYLGELNGVPLQDDAEAFQFNGNAYTYSFQKEQSSSSSIANSVKRAVQECTSWTESFQFGAVVGIKNIASIDTGYSEQWGGSTSSTAESSYEEAFNYAQKQVSSFSITFDERYSVGYYRWIMFGDLDVYAAIEYDLRTGEYVIDNYSVIAAQYFTLDYSPTSGRFNEGAYEQLPFDMNASDIERLPEPTEWISEEGVTGAGTQTDPYLLRSAEDFSHIRQHPDAYFRLMANISFADQEFEPIPQFSGSFDGNRYTVSDISFVEKEYSAETLVGLFGVNTGKIFDLTLENSSMEATPAFANKDISVYAGGIAAINRGDITDCTVRNVNIVANSSDTAERFMDRYLEDPRTIVQGSANWETWIRQSFYVRTNSWRGELQLNVMAGGMVGRNEGTLVRCKASGGLVEANVYNMAVSDSENYCQTCYAGGLAGYNGGGTISDCTSSVQTVDAWLEMSNDAGGMGWAITIFSPARSPRGICYAAGLVGCNVGGSVSGDAVGCAVDADSRIYFAVYIFLQGANYNEGNHSNANRLTIGKFDLYAPDGI